jgi:hypothetical protein
MMDQRYATIWSVEKFSIGRPGRGSQRVGLWDSQYSTDRAIPGLKNGEAAWDP